MIEQKSVALMTQGILWAQPILAKPWVREWLQTLKILVGVSGAFWVLARLAGWVAHAVHDSMEHSIGELFAVVYNLALSLTYASVLVHASYAERGGTDSFLAFQAAGFVLAYLTMSASFSGSDGEIDDYAWPAFWAGLGAYLFFCVRSQYLHNPVTLKAYAAVVWAMRGWLVRLVLYWGIAWAVLAALSILKYKFLRLVSSRPPIPILRRP